MKPSPLILACNDVAGAVFRVQQGDRLFVPYGNYQHPTGLQKFDRNSAQLMATDLRASSAGQSTPRLLTAPGRPIYKGHPDVPGRPDSNPAAPAVGWVTGISVENDGASFSVKWAPTGLESISSGEYRFYSPHWGMQRVPGGLQPCELRSIGLTNNPRIPVPSIANDSHTPAATVQERSAAIQSLVVQIRAEKRCNYDAAFYVAQLRRPDLFTTTGAENDRRPQATRPALPPVQLDRRTWEPLADSALQGAIMRMVVTPHEATQLRPKLLAAANAEDFYTAMRQLDARRSPLVRAANCATPAAHVPKTANLARRNNSFPNR